MVLRVGIPVRALIWLMLITCTFVTYMIRLNLSILLLAMVEPSRDASTSAVVVPECLIKGSNSTGNSSEPHNEPQTTVPDYGARYEWSSELQGFILSSYFWGFTLNGIPGSFLTERFGPTKVILISFLASGGLTILAPLAAAWHPYVLMATRLLIGVLHGTVYPSMHYLVARWAPPEEKGKFMGALLGGSLGTVCTWPMLGFIIENLGWSWGFFISGGICLVWCVLWIYFVSDTPATHRFITAEERDYIEKSLSGLSKKKVVPPYGKIAINVPFLTAVVLHFGNLWGLFFLMTAGPKFMSSVLGFNLGHTGILAALPYLARLLMGFVFGAVADTIRKNQWMRTVVIRKTFVLSSHILPGLLLLVQTFTGCDVNWSIALITMSLGLNGASSITNLQNFQDLSPNFAATLYGIANCIGSISGFISPTIVGYITAKHNGMAEWHLIFYIGASVYIAAAILFLIFGSGSIQKFNEIKEDEEERKQTNGVDNPTFEMNAENTKC